MAQRPAFHFGADFAPRGLDLAERRLAYLAELYDSGRWRRYFPGDADFLLVRQARDAVESWRGLLLIEPIEAWQSAPAITDLRATLAPEPGDRDEIDGAGDGFRMQDRGTRLPPLAFSRHAVVAEVDLAEA